MIIDANFILTVAKLALELGENIIVPMIHAFHHDKTPAQRDAAIRAVTEAISASKNCSVLPILPIPRETKF